MMSEEKIREMLAYWESRPCHDPSFEDVRHIIRVILEEEAL